MTPNQVTLTSAAFTFTGVACIALISPRWWLGLLVGLLLVIGYALDAADGQLARLQGGGSIAGEWLDHVVDATKNCLLHTAVLISFYRFTDLPRWTLLIPLGYQAVSCVFFFTFILVEKLRKGAGRGIHRGAAEGATGRGLAQTFLAAPTDYGVLCVCFLIFGWVSGFAVLYSLMFAANLAVLSVALLRWWKEMNTLSPAAGA
nr:CDP-alcohol phosphatidyltransferase family protein [Nakamurella flavida]